LPVEGDVFSMLTQVARLCEPLPSLTRLHVPAASTLHVVGDLHGQYWDFLQVLEMSGDPSPSNWYLFNGDLVDRGSFSVEVAIAVLALKLAAPDFVHVNRGNHESSRMNLMYGFQAEAKLKYSDRVFRAFGRAFNALPLAAVVNDAVFVVHGGLSARRSLRLAAIEALPRGKEPDDEADTLLLELLWSDPGELRGTAPSQRGCGVLFGADVTERFCADNGLLCVVRSHEMKEGGYEWAHDRRCLTVFSAANYCGFYGNSGAVCDVTPRKGQPRLELSDLALRTFEAARAPAERGGGGGGFARFGLLS